jgi:alkylation response protein AidB-like acyl-CoA dehydrogenase
MKDLASPGGGFLVSPLPAGEIFCRENFSEDQKMFHETAVKFFEDEVHTKSEEIERKEMIEENGEKIPLAVSILRKCAELGMVSIGIPEAYGGLGLDKTTENIIAESFAGQASFSTTVGAHAGIGCLPIILFGNKEQKEKYLPGIATAETVSCYGLTEPGSGSDALSGKTKAVLSEDGSHYVLTGDKMWITNGGWADIGVIFATIDGKYSALIVDLNAEGVTKGAEEKKMGIRGSSTTTLTFDGVKVPAENLLGEVGDAAKIALNILNVGRMKLGFGCLGTAKFFMQ